MRNKLPKYARTVPPQAKQVFKGVIFEVHQWEQEMFDGSIATFEMLRRPDTVIVIPVKDGKIAITEQEQPSLKPFLDFPGGRHDNPKETELEAAQRELREETGLVFKNWKLINIRQSHTKIEHFVYVFLATDFDKQVAQKLDAGEKITVKYYTFNEVKKLSETGKIQGFSDKLFRDLETLDDLLALPEYE